MTGMQCHRRLWWTVHDADAPELVPDADRQAIFDAGSRVGVAARAQIPGGVLIPFAPGRASDAIEATSRALGSGARILYEACFAHEGVFAAIDVLERRPEGFVLIEVKSTLSVKPQHVTDAAIQTWIARRSGIAVARTEVMHLNRSFRHPGPGDPFVRVDVTQEVERLIPTLETQLSGQRSMLTGSLPAVAVGEHCNRPYACPFVKRCWPRLPSDHVSELYYLPPERAVELESQGFRSIRDVPETVDLNPVAARQRRAVRARAVVVEEGLGRALQELEGPLAYLDFETIMPALPVWTGCAPYEQVPVQFSVHIERNGGLEHHAWLAEGDSDPRPRIAQALLDATAGSRSVLAYYAPFEEQQINALARAVPRLAEPLRELAGRLVDLLPLVRRHVYHPEFHGSFGLKKVLPALVPGLGYEDLPIAGGLAASRTLEALLLRSDEFEAGDAKRIRRDLLRYCERDTVALVRVLARLRSLAG